MDKKELCIMGKIEDPEILKFYNNQRNVLFRTPVNSDENLTVKETTVEITTPVDYKYSDLEDVLVFFINKEIQHVHFYDWDARLEQLIDDIGEDKALDQSEKLYGERYISFDIVRIGEDNDPIEESEPVSGEECHVDPAILKSAIKLSGIPRGKERIFAIARPKLRNITIHTEDEVRQVKVKLIIKHQGEFNSSLMRRCVGKVEKALRFLHMCRYIERMEMLTEKTDIESALGKSEELFADIAFSYRVIE